MKNNKAQITIFVILGLIVVTMIAMLSLVFKAPAPNIVDEKNPQAYIESCTREAVEEAISVLSEQGGEIVPKGSTMFRGKEITYLCYNEEFYNSCINQRPLLIQHIEKEIANHITPIVAACFFDLSLL